MNDDEELEAKVRRLVSETIEIVDPDPVWAERFDEEEYHLGLCLPAGILGRIEHFGSTAVPGLAAKPIVDMLIEVTSLDEVGERVVPILAAQGYDTLWRPTFGDDTGPWYWWFIKRDETGTRTHHLHMVEASFDDHWRRLDFRDHLIAHPELAAEYAVLKRRLAAQGHDRAEYTAGKSDFIQRVMGELDADPET